jgi:hypothetical protein
MDDADTVTEILRYGQGRVDRKIVFRPASHTEQVLDIFHRRRVQTDHGSSTMITLGS